MKCKFHKKCKFYDTLSRTCNKSGGMYYQDETRPAGCFRAMEKDAKMLNDLAKDIEDEKEQPQ